MSPGRGVCSHDVQHPWRGAQAPGCASVHCAYADSAVATVYAPRALRRRRHHRHRHCRRCVFFEALACVGGWKRTAPGDLPW